MQDEKPERSIGLLGATGVGVGAIVGGGILVVAGVAFEAAGPGAIVAFALNGFVAVLTALSFAEMSSAFPESGGTYTFAKKVLSVTDHPSGHASLPPDGTRRVPPVSLHHRHGGCRVRPVDYRDECRQSGNRRCRRGRELHGAGGFLARGPGSDSFHAVGFLCQSLRSMSKYSRHGSRPDAAESTRKAPQSSKNPHDGRPCEFRRGCPGSFLDIGCGCGWAAASLIFLVSFALANGTGILARRRGDKGATTFRTPWFPVVQVTGACTCLALAIFQGIMVPAAGVLVSLWLGLGGIVYVGLLARRARVFDASRQAQDPYLVQLRGRSPLVLVPIANPASAEAMVAVANALAPARVGRVLLLSVVTQPDKWEPGKPPRSLVAVERSAERGLKRIALDEVPGPASAEIVKTDDVASEISRRALENDLVILGLQRSGRRRKFFGELTLQIARSTNCGIIMIGRRD